MAERNKPPGKNSRRQGNRKAVPTHSWANAAYDTDGIPSPFLRVARDMGIDLSVPRQSSESSHASATAGNAPGQAAATSAGPLPPSLPLPLPLPVPVPSVAVAVAATSTTTNRGSSTAHAAKGRGGRSSKKAPTSRAAPVTPKKPKTGRRPKVTPSKRTHEDSFPDQSSYSGGMNGDEQPFIFDSDSDNALYKRNDRSDYTEHRSDEEDDPVTREHEYGHRHEDDDDDEYGRYYDGDDYHFKRQRR